MAASAVTIDFFWQAPLAFAKWPPKILAFSKFRLAFAKSASKFLANYDFALNVHCYTVNVMCFKVYKI